MVALNLVEESINTKVIKEMAVSVNDGSWPETILRSFTGWKKRDESMDEMV